MILALRGWLEGFHCTMKYVTHHNRHNFSQEERTQVVTTLGHGAKPEAIRQVLWSTPVDVHSTQPTLGLRSQWGTCAAVPQSSQGDGRATKLGLWGTTLAHTRHKSTYISSRRSDKLYWDHLAHNGYTSSRLDKTHLNDLTSFQTGEQELDNAFTKNTIRKCY